MGAKVKNPRKNHDANETACLSSKPIGNIASGNFKDELAHLICNHHARNRHHRESDEFKVNRQKIQNGAEVRQKNERHIKQNRTVFHAPPSKSQQSKSESWKSMRAELSAMCYKASIIT